LFKFTLQVPQLGQPLQQVQQEQQLPLQQQLQLWLPSS
jgi:hypothetical protein